MVLRKCRDLVGSRKARLGSEPKKSLSQLFDELMSGSNGHPAHETGRTQRAF